MKETHFYSSRIRSFIMFAISCIFIFILYNKDVGNAGLGVIIMFYLGFLFFSFTIVYSVLLLFRRKPLLTVTDRHIIINNVFIKPVRLNLEDISSFYISNTTFRGIKAGEYINIIMKNDVKGLNRKGSIIVVGMLNVKAKFLLEILNKSINS